VKINKEYILDEKDIKKAICYYIRYKGEFDDVFDDDNDETNVNFTFENVKMGDKLISIKLSAFVREEGCEC